MDKITTFDFVSKVIFAFAKEEHENFRKLSDPLYFSEGKPSVSIMLSHRKTPSDVANLNVPFEELPVLFKEDYFSYSKSIFDSISKLPRWVFPTGTGMHQAAQAVHRQWKSMHPITEQNAHKHVSFEHLTPDVRESFESQILRMCTLLQQHFLLWKQHNLFEDSALHFLEQVFTERRKPTET